MALMRPANPGVNRLYDAFRSSSDVDGTWTGRLSFIIYTTPFVPFFQRGQVGQGSCIRQLRHFFVCNWFLRISTREIRQLLCELFQLIAHMAGLVDLLFFREGFAAPIQITSWLAILTEL